jgi:hypothetical protein
MVGVDEANLNAKVFFIWGSLCTCCFVYAYFLVPETKGLSLEQVDRMLEETNARKSAKWVPHSTFAQEMGLAEKGPVQTVENTGNPGANGTTGPDPENGSETENTAGAKL